MNTKQQAWPPVLCLSLTGFIYVTTELLPIGLLPDIARDFGESEAATGLLVTFYAWLVALCSLPLTVLCGRLDRRKLLLAILSLFVISQWLAAAAPNILFLGAARLLTALSHSIFWSITPPLVVKLAPYGKVTRSLAVLSALVSLASVLGMPLGTMVGHQFGWRISFILVGVFALALAIPIVKALPPSPAAAGVKFSSLASIFKTPILARVYLLTLLTVTAHFSAFTYISPLLAREGGFSPSAIAWLLLWLGFSGVMGSLIINRQLDIRPRASIAWSLAFFTLSLWTANYLGAHLATAILLCFMWGASLTASTLYFQTTVLKNAPRMADVANSAYSSMFNVGIGGGALLGHQMFSRFGVPSVTLAGGLLALAALALAIGQALLKDRPKDS